MTKADMSLADVARLAQVARPVVSMWRRRYRDADLPFPAPTNSPPSQPAFDAAEIGRWLHDTGRGNNPSALLDADAFRSGIVADPAETDALTALLCLKVLSGRRLSGLSAVELLDLADDYDPDNHSLYREMEATGDKLAILAATAEALADAVYSPAAAFDLLLTSQRRLGLKGAEIHQDAISLVAAAAVALLNRHDGSMLVVDHSPGSSDTLLKLSEGDGTARCVLAWEGFDSAASRRGLRRLLTHGLAFEAADDDAGPVGEQDSALHLAQFPHAENQDPDDVAILNAVDGICLWLTDDDRAVALGPASALCDALGMDGAAGESEAIRSAILRTGRLRAVVRLPQGFITSKPRQAMALWVLGPAHAEVALADRWTMVSDLSGTSLSTTDIEDLISDLAAAMGNQRSVEKHSFRFARLVRTSSLLAARGSLVRVRPLPRNRTAQPADAVLDIENLLSSLQQPQTVRGLDMRVIPTPTPESPMERFLGDLADAGAVAYLPGNRIDAADLHAGDPNAPGAITVITAGSLLDGDPPAVMDRFRFAAHYPAGRLTEPGDVVFCTGPRPVALVDPDGAAVVAYPARILRIVDGGSPRRGQPGLVARLLAEDINNQAPTARRWRSWTVRAVDVDQRDLLRRTLDAVEQERLAALQRVNQLDQLATLIMDGVASNTVTLGENTPAAPMEGTP
ncbi:MULTISPECIES: hypothetical protein [unclassified Arthrobacter]|uniref:hypothetical protein n=1 Tax=unclassified Arthrobacter TaxID=235627 RepID=UPI0014919E69|nr:MULTISPECIES: hypothetical protein [unclassified Arthrobacter]MBE0009804.1 hypothetical protein [Arthrobacter sp. AET 35A]NOJ63696.1 hypothetical protein [Arthrobacter sp. 147(2020)]